MSEKTKWYQSWFDSKYYHLLYQHRNDEEAVFFINNLLDHLQLPLGAAITDLACGKGRHSRVIADRNYNVTGVDISSNNIHAAQVYAHNHLQFAIHDMRTMWTHNTQDAVFNLFTSFGYFDNENDNNKTLRAIHKALKSAGVLVIDFLNIGKLKNLFTEKITQEKIIDGIHFTTCKYIENNFIVKDIFIKHDNNEYQFQERVQAITKSDFEDKLHKNNFKIINIFGNYSLGFYDESYSDRLIILAQNT